MNELISSIFGDPLIELDCARSGECVHESQIPGYHPPATPPFSSFAIIVMSALSVAIILAVLFGISCLNRRQLATGEETQSLMDEEQRREQEQHLMADHTPSILSFSNISYFIEKRRSLFNRQPTRTRRPSTTVPIPPEEIDLLQDSTQTRPSDSTSSNANVIGVLHDVQGVVRPGEIMAIMGGR